MATHPIGNLPFVLEFSVSTERAESVETVNVLSERAKEFFNWAKTSGLSTSDNESENKTVAIVKYCWNLSELHKRQNALNQHKYLLKRAEIPKEANAKKRDLDELPEQAREALTFIFVEEMGEVLAAALEDAPSVDVDPAGGDATELDDHNGAAVSA